MTSHTERYFHDIIKSELSDFLDHNKLIYPDKDLIRIDLHCHDHNSNVPDEQLGRILNISETWLPTENLINTLNIHRMDLFTITNHNNGRSCFEMLDKGNDILVGAEFSCLVPEFQAGIHVLTYGFSPEQEVRLNKFRKNLYSFLDYTQANNLPVIWAHPLYNYRTNGKLSIDFYNKLALLFERFEVLNGQRDSWQNMLVKRWIEGLTEERIDDFSRRFKINSGKYCRDPYRKSMSGGSDSHMGIFSGLTGTQLYIADLEEKRKEYKLSELALDSIRNGRMIPFGGQNNSEKMMITFLDFVCQIAINGKDPGLFRIMLHNGEIPLKITALLVANGFSELRQHKVTMKFIRLFHDCLTGIEPHFTKRWLIPKEYKPIFDQAKIMARTFQSNPDYAVEIYSESINKIYDMLGNILDVRLSAKMKKLKKEYNLAEPDLNKIISGLELPAELRNYLGFNRSRDGSSGEGNISPDVSGFLDGLSFPFLSSTIILSAHFTSAYALYKNRPFLNNFSKALGCLEHPKRMLWISDTWGDNNGISMLLKSLLDQIRIRNLPIDIMICSNAVKSEDHLIVIKPHSQTQIHFYKDQKFNIPNFLDIHHIFLKGEYDRIMCSSEGPMGLAALYLKHAYSVPAFFYMHTDWISFARKVLRFEKENMSRLRRLLRVFYKDFDAVFVLNSDHYALLTTKKMALTKSSIYLTSHWRGAGFFPRPPAKKLLFKVKKDKPVMLFAGRISYEKGVMELPWIYKAVRSSIPDIQMVIAGSGPVEEQLKKALPDAIYLGWVDPVELPAIYSSADLLILPSKHDTFSCVVLESLSCGLPVIAYNSKSPKDIIINGVNGYLVSNSGEIIQQTIAFLGNQNLRELMKKAAVERSKEYTADQIINKLLMDTGLASQNII